MTMTNGSADTIVMFLRPLRASAGSDPPASSMTAATPPVAVPQKMTERRVGSSAPFSLSAPMTIDAESAPVTKKIAMRMTVTIMRITETAPGSGSAPSMSKRMRSKLMSGAPSTMYASASTVPSPRSARSWMPIAPPPKIANHSSEMTDGTSRTPVTNWRIVRPREMRAMKRPTNGDHDTHQAQ